jgi:hypothetical protein
MGPRRLTRSRVVRAVVLGVAVGLLWAATSCILADPPPGLAIPPALPPTVTSIEPHESIITVWPPGALTFNVDVDLVNPPPAYLNWAMVQDNGTVDSRLVGNACTACGPADDGGGVSISVPVSLSDSNCHTYTLFLDTGKFEGNAGDPAWNPQPGGPPAVVTCSSPSLCAAVEWLYDPTGAGNCPDFDAGGAHDAHDTGAGDTIIIHPTDSHAGN